MTSDAPADVTRATAAAGVAEEAARADHKHDVSTAAPSTVGTANAEGAATSLARSDHVHSHGNQLGGALHAVATTSVAGFMSATDKVALAAAVSDIVTLGAAVASLTREINVLDYGATGDGSTDDTAACQDAIDAAEAATGNDPVTVYFPPGTYVVDPLYVGASNLRIRGAGAASTVKRKAVSITNPDSIGVINFHGTSMARLSHVGISEIRVDGNKANVTPGDGVAALNNECVSFTYCDHPTADRVVAVDSTSEGLDFDYCADGLVSGCHGENLDGCAIHFSLDCVRMHARGCTAYACGVVHSRPGFDVHSSAADCSYTDCHTRDCYRGFVLAGDHNQVVGCSDYLSDTNSFRLEGHHNTVSGCRSRDVSNGNGLTLVGDYNTVTGCVIYGASASGIGSVSGAINNTVVGNVLRANGAYGINIAAGVNNNLVAFNQVSGNTTAGTLNSGTGNTLTSNQAT